jgi:hypothetical protein
MDLFGPRIVSRTGLRNEFHKILDLKGLRIVDLGKNGDLVPKAKKSKLSGKLLLPILDMFRIRTSADGSRKQSEGRRD